MGGAAASAVAPPKKSFISLCFFFRFAGEVVLVSSDLEEAEDVQKRAQGAQLYEGA